MRISRDVTFDESRSYYPRSPTVSPDSLAESISFLIFPDSQLSTTVSPHPPSTLPPSPPAPPVSPPPDFPSRSFVEAPPFPLHYSRRPRPTTSPLEPPSLLGPVPSPSSPSLLGPAPPSPPRYDLRDRHTVRPPKRYGFAAAALSEPTTYREAAAHPEWQLAMSEEIAALERTSTWDLVPLPARVTPITCKWVYKIKTRSDGSLERYKARLVARGFQQEHGRDYDETFALVAHMTIVRTLLVVVSVRQWFIS